jgi:hypothetical protein
VIVPIKNLRPEETFRFDRVDEAVAFSGMERNGDEQPPARLVGSIRVLEQNYKPKRDDVCMIASSIGETLLKKAEDFLAEGDDTVLNAWTAMRSALDDGVDADRNTAERFLRSAFRFGDTLKTPGALPRGVTRAVKRWVADEIELYRSRLEVIEKIDLAADNEPAPVRLP